MDKRIKFRTYIYIVTTILLLIVFTVLIEITGLGNYINQNLDINYFDLLLGQIANTLIVLSLTSVLSSNFGQAYWVDIKETKLISPFWGCFVGITVYLLTALLYSLVVYFFRCNVGVVVSAIFSTGLLVVLTYKMISIYFGKEELKKQLKVEYKKMLIFNNFSYPSDCHSELEKFLKEVENIEFKGKSTFITNLKNEIKSVDMYNQEEKEGEEQQNFFKIHADRYFENQEKLKEINLKIEEYTKNAINKNNTEVIRENIDLLVECESYSALFDLIEDLFEWDENYTCKMLKEISKNSKAWLLQDKMLFFKQYALQKLITQSGKLDALQYLLMVYDSKNKGSVEIQKQIQVINDKIRDLDGESLRAKKDGIQSEYKDIFNKATTNDLRAFYIPIKEACVSYDEGRYEVVNKYVDIIIKNFKDDCLFIKNMFPYVADKSVLPVICFSYVTNEEMKKIEELIKKDEHRQIISERNKQELRSMEKVVIDHNPFSDITAEGLAYFSSLVESSKETEE